MNLQNLFTYFHEEHGVLLLESDMLFVVSLVETILEEQKANNVNMSWRPIAPKEDSSFMLNAKEMTSDFYGKWRKEALEAKFGKAIELGYDLDHLIEHGFAKDIDRWQD